MNVQAKWAMVAIIQAGSRWGREESRRVWLPTRRKCDLTDGAYQARAKEEAAKERARSHSKFASAVPSKAGALQKRCRQREFVASWLAAHGAWYKAVGH